MTNWRRAYVPGGTYFFTLVTADRAPILTTPIGHHGLLYLARVQVGEPGRAADYLAQAVVADGRQGPGSGEPDAQVDQPRQVLEAVEEVRAHGGDDEQGAVGVLQRGREQAVEVLALVGSASGPTSPSRTGKIGRRSVSSCGPQEPSLTYPRFSMRSLP